MPWAICEDSELINRLLCLATLAIFTASLAQSNDRSHEAMQREVAAAFGQCAAYYEISTSVLEATNSPGVDDARSMKGESMAMAISLLTEFDGLRKAKKNVDREFADAIEAMHEQATNEPEAFKNWAQEYRKSCRMAVNDPETFAEQTLAGDSKARRRFPSVTLPKNLTVETIRKYGKPMTKPRNISACTAPARAFKISLDDALVESGMVCTRHHGDVCESERRWMSYKQYIAHLYPDYDLVRYSQTHTVTYKNAQRQDTRTLLACLIVPEMST